MFLTNSDNLKMDSLLECLVLFTKLYHKPFSAEALTAGLPIEMGKESPELFSINNAKGLFSRAAEKAGLKSSLLKRPISQISPLQLPMIILLSNQGSCIIDQFSKDRLQAKIIMPAEEAVEQWVDMDVLESEYIGYGFMVKKAFEYNDESSRTLHLDQKHWFWSTVKLSTGAYKDVLYASFLINLFVLASPMFTMNVYDRVVPNNAIETLWVFAIGIVIVYILSTFLKFTRTYLLESAARKSDVIMSSIIFEKVLNLKMTHHSNSVGSFASHLRDFDSIRNFLTNATMTAIIDLPFAILFLFVIGYIGGYIVLIPIITTIFIIAYAMLIKKTLRSGVESIQEANAKKNSILIESLSNIETLKTLGTLGQAQWNWEESTGEIANKSSSSRLLSASIPTITQFLIQLNTVASIVYGVYLIQAFELSMGGLIAIIILTSRVLAPMAQVASLLTNYENTKSSYETINNIINLESERPHGKKFVQKPEFTGLIEFSDVTFTYPQADIPALKNVSFTIQPGEHVAIIGRIGSGKSTIQKLLLGLYEPDSGQILIDGIDINQIDPADLRKSISYVSQDIMLFRGTVKDNILYRATHASETDMIRASRISGTYEFVKKHPKGYEMTVGDRGQGLSGGQRQSIGIARAFLLNSPIMLMDEPSNAMDQLTEAKLLEQLSINLEGKTSLLVTQKMTLLKIVSRVIVINEGRVFIDSPKESALVQLQGGGKKIEK
ncbi:MAG: type I secretion system permease/ATPase [Epsilonproteobacteria bacterium]|nr:type I secretion system permease/ATPase [Campylobacterota bacterium]PIP10469.1 MAG: type I secretion system permease/ATPase [Sulfurimonas sp. CG23_combo_of_CG06-09_8_20_14_all_36_33]PIS26098.1 MAG: type I secretion system permease/ATPase [Sulfurimonas sp. CG08_land_8_20_14_0_20_36_33]PIU35985.1 MAG: type I secretion system permease/ATPase [Sulfurimonas sp. CG07_land_8_20_14_0_80_36_56]PIV02787.1 MAG: type I secretion system permease/ATPase [Sulfurimonas sp. CG03_land_8_20_14_0_80_36_25]PIV3